MKTLNKTDTHLHNGGLQF